MNFITNILVGIYHAKYHRNLKKAIRAKNNKNIYQFKKYIYRAEDAWKKIVTIKKKQPNE